MNQAEKSESFVRQLTENQNRLYGYVYSLLGDHSRAADVVQETNLVLWRRIDEYDPGRPFLAWAFGVARFQVLADLRDRSRDKLLLDAELAEAMSSVAEKQAEQMDLVRVALVSCLQRLSPESRQLVEARYQRDTSIAQVAVDFGRSVSAVKVSLMRVRRQLAACIQQRVSADGASQ